MADRDRWDDLFDEAEAEAEVLDALRETSGLMSSHEGITTTTERGDGFLIVREVRVTEPWHVSLVRLAERPRTSQVKASKTCAHCGRDFMGHGKARYCGGSCRVAAYRASK